MKRIKKSLLALAAFCAITSSAGAYTLPASQFYKHPDIPKYQARFYTTERDSTYNEKSSGKCSFCWYDDCYDFEYIWDGKMTVFVQKIGMFFIMGDKLNSSDGKIFFEQMQLPTCIHCNDR